MEKSDWQPIILDLYTLGLQLEAEGQYNFAKLARATADGLARRVAFERNAQIGAVNLVAEAKKITNSLSELDINQDLLKAFQNGIYALEDNRLPLINETPHPFVCRTCGLIFLGKVSKNCPTCNARPETFQRFLPIYWLERFTPQESLLAFKKTPAEIAALIEGLSEQALQQPASDGGWSIRNVISHVQDAQQVLFYRLDIIMKEEHPILASKAVFQWAANEEARPANTHEILQNYKKTREDLLKKLEVLSFEDWQRSCFHEEFGTVTLQQQASYFATHEITHLPQIQQLREQFILLR